MIDLICRCNHKFSKHIFTSPGYIICNECWDSDMATELLCEDFIPDNLKYLEQIYKQKENSHV